MFSKLLEEISRKLRVVKNTQSSADGNIERIIIIAHSASGKSTLLNLLKFDRSHHDMDVYLQQNKKDPTLDTFIEFISQEVKIPVFVCSNDFGLLNKVRGIKSSLENTVFLFIHRNFETLEKLLVLKNADGILHPKHPSGISRNLYSKFESVYLNLADFVIELNETDISHLSNVMQPFVDRLLTDGDTSDTPGNGMLSDTEYFNEYQEIQNKYNESPIDVLDQKTMRDITAGGYQVFDANTFPPVPNDNSICAKKLKDLRWKAEEFRDCTVAEIGCQLGFFCFEALALGASEVVGFDLNKRYIDEANKISLNYKRNIGKWEKDRVKFVKKSFGPDERLPFTPDIIVANSIIHWWIIQNSTLSVRSVLEHLKTLCKKAVYFEGCVTSDESIMRQHDIALDRYNEDLFLEEANNVFNEVKLVGRCTYNKQRLVARLIK